MYVQEPKIMHERFRNRYKRRKILDEITLSDLRGYTSGLDIRWVNKF